VQEIRPHLVVLRALVEAREQGAGPGRHHRRFEVLEPIAATARMISGPTFAPIAPSDNAPTAQMMTPRGSPRLTAETRRPGRRSGGGAVTPWRCAASTQRGERPNASRDLPWGRCERGSHTGDLVITFSFGAWLRDPDWGRSVDRAAACVLSSMEREHECDDDGQHGQ
jgi:hypothetical protein